MAGRLDSVTSPQHHDRVLLPIVQLVRRRVGDSGLSLREFARERKIAYSTLRHYHAPALPSLKQPPRPQVLRDLARALQVPLSEVEAAADQSVSRVRQNEVSSAPMIDSRELPDGLQMMIATYQRLSDVERRRMERLIRAGFDEAVREGDE